jgi:predicted phosphatase
MSMLVISWFVSYFLFPTTFSFFFSTEALEAAGILDMDQAFDSNGIEKESIKRRALNKISEIRTTVRQKLDGENIKKWMEHDRMGALGAATGAFFGFLL